MPPSGRLTFGENPQPIRPRSREAHGAQTFEREIGSGAVREWRTALPLSYEDGDSWRRAAARAVQACVGGDGSSFELAVPGVPLIAAEPEVERALKAVDPPPDWVVQALTVRRRELGLTVTDWEELFNPIEVKRTAFYNEVARPQGVLAPVTMLTDTGFGPIPAALSVYSADEAAARRYLNERKAVLRLLFSAYCAGLKTYLTYRQNHAALCALAEDAPIGVLVLDAKGYVTSENSCFQQSMRGDPDRERVRADAAFIGRSILATRMSDSRHGKKHTSAEVQTTAARYRMTATLFEDQRLENGFKAVVLVDRIDERVIDARHLADQYLLTQREIEIAHLLRKGLSTKDIANRLDIAVNTTRRHLEKVYLKLDVHTRTSAAAKLSGT